MSDTDDDFWAMPEEVPSAVFKGSLSAAIIGGMQKWARKPADLYPTPVDCTYSLIPRVRDLIPSGSRVLEPACADGQMVRPLREYGYEVDGYDLRPDVLGGEGGVDFLDRENGVFEQDSYDAVWTNPPFVVAEPFIKRALEIAPVAVMLLKSQYFHAKTRGGLWAKHKPSRIFALTWRPSFLEAERGKSPLMDCLWVVWERGHEGPCEYDRLDRLLECPVNIEAMDMGGL